MSIITEFTVDAEEFVLAEAFAAVPEVTVELERIVPTTGQVFPLLFAWNCTDVEAFEAVAHADPAIEALTLIDELRDGQLYRVTWSTKASECRDVLVETEATVLEAVGTQNAWRFEIRFPDSEHAAAFQAAARERAVPLELRKLSELTAMDGGRQYGLTATQRETILEAYEAGYFEEPRGITLAELAEQKELSPRAVSGRVRRGLAELIANTLDADR